MSKKKTTDTASVTAAKAEKASKVEKTAKVTKTKAAAGAGEAVAAKKTAARKPATAEKTIAEVVSVDVKTSKAKTTAPKETAKTAPKTAIRASKAKLPVNGPEGGTTAAAPITHDDIAKLAYSYAEARGFSGGSPEEDWVRAESELRSVRGLA